MRHEYKYLVPNYLIDDIRAAIRPYLDVDDYAVPTGGQYTVRSIYFDSSDLTCYWEKEAGIKDRKKLRVRGYNRRDEKSKVFLEIKRKTNSLISKNRALLPYSSLLPAFRDIDPIQYVREEQRDQDDARRFFYHLRRQSMVPIETVLYEREPFNCRFRSSLRVTFDRNLRSVLYPGLENLYDETDVVPALPDHFILEVKCDVDRGFPGWVKGFLARFDLKKQALSKYVICLDTHGVARNSRDDIIKNALASGVPL
jgi:hypothetical protein